MDQEASESKLERPLGPGEAIVFSEQNYEGQEQLVTADTSLLDFPAASLRVGPKTGVTVFFGENYQGLSQELTTDLNSFTASRLQDQPKSLKVWSAAGKLFIGFWAIGIKVGEESTEGRYLSTHLDGLLTTSPRVSERERFRITEGLTGWASARYLALAQPPLSGGSKPLVDPHTGVRYRATAKLNVREGPGTNFRAVGYLQSNEIVEVLEANADRSWLRIHRKPDVREAALGRRKVALSLPDIPLTEPASTLQPRPLFIQDLENLTFVDEPEAGFRRFSLLSQDNRWICYSPEGNHFLTSAKAEERTIFCQSIKLAEDETQVGELFQGEVALYENPAFWGRAWVFYTDYADFDRVLDLNDEVSSIQLGPLTGVTIYRGAQFAAEDKDKGEGKQDVISNLSSLAMEQVGEDQISSMQIWRIVPPGGSDVKVQCCLSQDFHTVEGDFKEYSAYRTTLRLPPTVETVEVWATDQTDIEVDDKKYPVSEDQSVMLKPNLAWCLVITTDAIGDFGGSLRAPGLKIRTDTMQPHERIVVFPDQEAHEKLAGKLKEDKNAMWEAEYEDENGIPHKVIDRSKDEETAVVQRKNAEQAQEMIQNVMSTVKYSEGNPGTRIQTISPPDELHKRGWVLYFHTYMVTADTLYVRQGPGRGYESVGFLQRNDIVEPLEFKSDGGWIKVRRLSDGLTGWSSSRYLKTGERYRVTARKLHLREGPGTKFPSLGYIAANEIVTGIGVNEDGTWRQIRRSDGSTGWSAARYFALLPSPPMAPVPGPPQTVNYQEMSQGDVQTLLAVAQFPDTDLAQGLFSDIISAIKKAVSITVSTVEDALTIIIEMVDKAVAWVVDTAEKVFAFVEGIFEKIGALIKDVIQWLRFVFDWDGILETRDYLRENINQALDYLGSTFVDQAKQTVTSSAGNVKSMMNDRLNKTIVALGGDPRQPAVRSEAASGIISKIKSTGIPDALDWILSKIMSAISSVRDAFQNLLDAVGLGDGKEAADGEDENLLEFWDKTLVKGLDEIMVAPAGVADVVVMLAKNPDEPLLAVAGLLRLFRDLLGKLIDFGETVALGLLDSVAYAIQKFREILAKPFRIPFISDLIDWINHHLGLEIPTLPSLLDVFTLVLAVPITIISKITINEPPFKPDPEHAQSKSGWDIAIGVIGCFNSLINVVLDAKDCLDIKVSKKDTKDSKLHDSATDRDTKDSKLLDSSPDKDTSKTNTTTNDSGFFGFLEAMSVACGISAWGLLFISPDEEKTQDPKKSGKTSENLVTGFEGFLCLVDLFSIIMGRLSEKTESTRLKRAGKNEAWAGTGLGVGHLVLLLWKDLDTGEGFGSIVADVLTTIPEILSFVTTNDARKLSYGPNLVGSDFVAAGASIVGMF